MTAPAPGDRCGAWLVLAVDGRRVFAQCACGVRRWLAADALAPGSSCGCAPAPDLRRAIKADAEQRQRRRARDWRPGR